MGKYKEIHRKFLYPYFFPGPYIIAFLAFITKGEM
jgi:hypothetical protein